MTARSRTRIVFAAIACLLTSSLLVAQQARDAGTIITTGTAAISGRLVADDATNAPVRRATLTLTGDDLGAARLLAVTDDAGAFAFARLPAGRYALEATKAGYLPLNYGGKRPGAPGISIVVADGQRVAGLEMKLLKGSVMTGMVTDDLGQPIRDVKVTAFVFGYVFPNLDGRRRLSSAPFASSQLTDDRGMYRIYGLAPGDYVVAASAAVGGPDPGSVRPTDLHQTTDADIRRAQQLLRTPADRSMVNYATVYYPGAFVASDATPITLGPHEERAGIDVLLRLVPTARVEGVIIGPDAAPLAGVSVTMMDPAPQSDGIFGKSLRNARSDADGKFVLPGIGPGTYTTIASMRTPPQDPSWGMTEVTVAGEDVTTTIFMSPGVKVTGRTVFEGALPRPDNLLTVLPLLYGDQEYWTMLGLLTPAAQADGAFTYTAAPGPSRLGAAPFRKVSETGWHLKSAMLNGVDLLDVVVEIRPNENIDGVVMTLTDQRAEISGQMMDAAGVPAPGATIIVFSADKRFWLPQSRRTQQVRPSADGRYLVQGLPAGDYLMVAVTDVEEGQWHDPSYLAELAPYGIQISLAEGEKKIQNLRVGG